MELLELRQFAGLATGGLLPYGPAPVIGLGYDVELGSHGGIAYPPELDLKPEEVDAASRGVVQPIKGRPVLLSEATGNPNDCHGLESRGVREQLVLQFLLSWHSGPVDSGRRRITWPDG